MDDSDGALPARIVAAGPVTPLITAAEMYPLLERTVAAARTDVTLSFRIFDTRTALRTDEARAAAGGGGDWAALLVGVAARGVRVRLQISDFDPIGGASLHREAWASLRHLSAAAAGSANASGAIEAMAARHEAELGAFWRRIFAARARREMRRVEAESKADGGGEPHPALRTVTSGGQPRLFPATHHQKMAAIDDDFALIGGLDLDERRWDTAEHDRPAGETWRDVSLALRGAAAAEVRAAIAEIWADCARAWAERDDLGDGIEALAPPTAWRAPPPVGDDAYAVVTTQSKRRRGVFAFSPRTVRNEIEETVFALARGAKRFIYIETQFLRHRPVAKALAAAARRNRDLELVAIIPFAPERYAFEGRRDTAMNHSEALQLAAIDIIRRAFGDRAAILSPAKDAPRRREDAFAAFGAGIVYLHSKVMIVDGETAMIGSANLNGRSLRWDTEAALIVRRREVAADLQKRLAESWGVDGGAAALASVRPWADAAAANAAVTPGERAGFLLPHDTSRARSFAKRVFWLPDDLF